MHFALFLHIYQPSTQFPEVLDNIVNESYRKIIAILKKNRHACVTINLASILVEQLSQYGYYDLLQDFKELSFQGRIEFTSSAKYHPLLPKLPRDEIIRQIELNDETNRKYLGEAYHPIGFFPPEMAYNRKLANVLSDMGFEWVILDESAYSGKKINHERVYKVKNLDLTVFFRETTLSLDIAFSKIEDIRQLKKKLGKRLLSDEYVLVAMDGETFGHHQPQQLKFFEDLCKFSEVKQILVSDILRFYDKEVEVDPLLSTWGTTLKDSKRGRVFPRWDNPKNPIHVLQWKLMRIAIRAVTKSTRDIRLVARWKKSRSLLDKAVQSDQFWWASHNPCWHPKMIEKGARMLRDVILISPASTDGDCERAKSLYERIIKSGKDLYGDEIIGC